MAVGLGPKRTSGGKNEKPPGGPPEMYERRALKTVTLTPPHYRVNPSTLLDSFIEKEVKFAGIIHNIPVELDTTNRTDVLRVVDRGKREEKIPWRVTHEHDAIFCLTVHNVKISHWGGNEELRLRVPIHEIAAISYIRDDSQHILALKYGDTDSCQLAVLYCDKQGSAEELCALIDQCFQLVYSEATRQYYNIKISEGSHTNNVTSISSSSATRSGTSSSSGATPPHQQLYTDVFAQEEASYNPQYHSNMSTPTAPREVPGMTIFTQSRLDLDQQAGTISTSNDSRSHPPSRRPSSATPSESDLSAATDEQRNEYVMKLNTKLTPTELRRFAVLLKEWSSNMMPCAEFCEKVLELYGPNRKNLLEGMRPFIPDEDTSAFETFLEKRGLGQGNWSDTHSPNPRFRHPVSRASTFSSHQPYMNDEFDRILNDISADIDNLQTSVDMNTNPESFLPKST